MNSQMEKECSLNSLQNKITSIEGARQASNIDNCAMFPLLPLPKLGT